MNNLLLLTLPFVGELNIQAKNVCVIPYFIEHPFMPTLHKKVSHAFTTFHGFSLSLPFIGKCECGTPPSISNQQRYNTVLKTSYEKKAACEILDNSLA